MTTTMEGLTRKINRAKELQSVVRTMKILAASNVGQFERSVQALNAFYRTVQLGLSVRLREGGFLLSPKGNSLPNTHRLSTVVVFGSDQGLVGQFNERLVAHTLQILSPLPSKLEVWVVGERMAARLADAGLSVERLFPVPNSVKGIAPLVGRILVDSATIYGQDSTSELHIFYNRYNPGVGYAPSNEQLFPLDQNWTKKLTELPWPTKVLPEMIGGDSKTLQSLIHEYLFVLLFRACAESLASENTSRLTAMDRADKNINELLERLHRTHHRVRQNNIDAELFDVLSGYKALLDT
jgi:F-type H+-transporting ATPase subunit gamma